MKEVQKWLSAVFAALFLVCASVSTIAEEADAELIAVNINTASAEELASALDGVGEARAELIIKFREEQGPFTSVEQLLEIKGVGAATLEKNRDKIQL
ncbi:MULTISPECIES: ComEA family DNA-binding protein [unclassified Microbulbifer]|uniref:ComEA family DNA-binding protein n=1 Tax=unclassified Microbulbifer TaxID=2619833 RepID=UPI0027E416C2|nr:MULTISPECIES: ComEA family DNA-binding protein [unclassified Microbulbifer]